MDTRAVLKLMSQTEDAIPVDPTTKNNVSEELPYINKHLVYLICNYLFPFPEDKPATKEILAGYSKISQSSTSYSVSYKEELLDGIKLIAQLSNIYKVDMPKLNQAVAHTAYKVVHGTQGYGGSTYKRLPTLYETVQESCKLLPLHTDNAEEKEIDINETDYEVRSSYRRR